MDIATIDAEYSQLEQEAQQTFQSVQALATKLQTADGAGDANAKDWLLDLKGIALQIQQEQLQMQTLLQALHGFAINTMQPAAPPAAPVAAVQPAAAQQGGGGMLQNFMGSGFGRAIEMGAGFGVGNQIINSIFG